MRHGSSSFLILYNKYLIVTCMTRCWQWVWEEEAVEPGTEEEEAVVRWSQLCSLSQPTLTSSLTWDQEELVWSRVMMVRIQLWSPLTTLSY